MPWVSAAKNREYQARWYKANRKVHFARLKKRKTDLQQWLRNYKAEHGCLICKENHPAALDFHHRDPAMKETDMAYIVKRGWGKKRILAEIAKCDILCANCHRKAHWAVAQQ